MPEPSTSATPLRSFGRFELRALLFKSERSMAWRVFDPGNGLELMLCMPREQPNSAAAMEHWHRMVQAGARVQHPQLAPVFEIGQIDSWPYVAYDRTLGETLDERLARQSAPLPVNVADWIAQLLEGLAFAHEAGHAHHDIQSASLIIDTGDKVRLVGLEVAQEVLPADVDFNTVMRRAVRESAQEDVLRVGLLLHRLLTGRHVLGQSDLRAAMQQMQPLGREVVRLGWETPHPIPDPLRAICNRATDRQARQRYHLARSFWRALDGWRTSAGKDGGGPVALLLDKLQRGGHLPASTTGPHRFTSGNALSTHASALSELVLQDMALSLELLRRVNLSLRQSGHQGEFILSIQRAIQLLGLNGVQQAANLLKPWPGLLQPLQADWLRALMARVAKAGQVAQALRPAGYDAEVVYMVAVMQNLGRLLLQYHSPDDAQQIRQLMVPPEQDHRPPAGGERRPPPEAGEKARGGPSLPQAPPNPAPLSEQAAAYAVLGCDLDTLGAAVVRYWGLGDELAHMVRRQPLDSPVHATRSDAELIRLTCSLANELIDALGQPEHRRRLGVELATRRYARPLSIGLPDVLAALNPGSAAAPQPGAVTPQDAAPRPLDAPAQASASGPSPLRAKLTRRIGT